VLIWLDQAPGEIIREVLKYVFSETDRNDAYPIRGAFITSQPDCEHKQYDQSLGHYRPASDDCLCSGCDSRHRCLVRRFIKSPVHKFPNLHRFAADLYKKAVRFIYSPYTEEGNSAYSLDEFFYYFGAPENIRHEPAIKHLTIRGSWKVTFAHQLDAQTKSWRHGEPLDERVPYECQEELSLLRQDTYRLLRIFSVLLHYKVKANIIFPYTHIARKPFFEHLYVLRKKKAPRQGPSGGTRLWWRLDTNTAGSSDITAEEIVNDETLRDLYLQGERLRIKQRSDLTD
jgi:hypothetical protein